MAKFNELDIAIMEVMKCLLSKEDRHIDMNQYDKVIAFLAVDATQESGFGIHTRDIAMHVVREAQQKCIDNRIASTLNNVLAFIDPEFCVRHAYNYCLSLENSHEEDPDLGMMSPSK